MTSSRCPRPVGSISRRWGRARDKSWFKAICIGSPFVQHIHPPGTSLRKTSFSVLVSASIRLASTPTSPNSLTKTAQRSFFGFWLSSLRIAVVFPTPRNPEIILVGTLAIVSVGLVIIKFESLLSHLLFRKFIGWLFSTFLPHLCISLSVKRASLWLATLARTAEAVDLHG